MNKTLMEKSRCMLSGSKLGKHETPLTHLKLFEYDAYVHAPKENLSKLDKKDEKCIFIGYKYGLKGYKLCNP